MSGRVIRGCGPKHLSARKGRGWRTCEASGFTRYADDVVEDVRQGRVAKEFADLTPGFETHHPQDVVNLPTLDDPSPIHKARPEGDVQYISDMQVSDAEIKLSIQEGRAPRPGY